MKNDKVYYINVKPYVYNLNFQDMAERYFNAFNRIITVDKSDFINYIVTFMKKYRFTITPKNDNDYNVDKYVSKHMMYHIKSFFNGMKMNKTIKKCKSKRKIKTKKNII
jgi:hypothetical protein